MSPFRTLGRLAAIVSLATLAACSGTDTGTGPSTSAAKGGGGGGGGTTPGFYSGFWVQSPPSIGFLQDGTRQELSIEATLTQSGNVISGTGRKFVSYYHPDGTSVTHISVGTPGKISGTVTAAGINFSIIKLGEPKLNYSFTLVLSADSTRLVAINPPSHPDAPTSFTR
jgi:hypothetical protein